MQIQTAISLKKLIHQPSWLKQLDQEWDKTYLQRLESFLQQQQAEKKIILPPQQDWFNALNSLPFEKIKVVILGQDPYPTIGHAHGLSFSVSNETRPLPKSLLNIYKELYSDLQIDNQHTGNLQYWNEQGVLLLNSVLTVESGQANSHQGKGWELLTDKIIEEISSKLEHIVFILWGTNAQKKSSLIDKSKHLIIESAHPSPLSAYRGFWGSKPFSKTNHYLEKHNIKTIDWKLPDFGQAILFQN